MKKNVDSLNKRIEKLGLNLESYVVDKNIRIETLELRHLLKIVESYHNLLAEETVVEESAMDKIMGNVDFIKYFRDKYIILAEVRQKEHTWFTMKQKIESITYPEEDKEEADQILKEVIAEYQRCKTMRLQLLQEIESKKFEV